MHGNIYIYHKKEKTRMPYIHSLLHDDKKGGGAGSWGRCWFDNEYLMGEHREGKHSKKIKISQYLLD